MSIVSFTTVVPVPDLAEGVAFWSQLLSVEPTFVDGDRWAQFDAGGSRIALAGADRFASVPTVMLKSADLEATRTLLAAAGIELGEIIYGHHERRFTAITPGGWPIAIYDTTT